MDPGGAHLVALQVLTSCRLDRGPAAENVTKV